LSGVRTRWQPSLGPLCREKPTSKHHLGLLPSPCTAVFDLLTCKLHRLLGPCFKTGREWHCCTKLHCLQHHTLSGGPTVRPGHHQSGAATTEPPAPPWPGVGTGMSEDTPGTSCVIHFRRQAADAPRQAPSGDHHAAGSPNRCTPFWDLSSLRPSQADCHHIAATIASNPGELGSVASSGLAQGRLESIASCGRVGRHPRGCVESGPECWLMPDQAHSSDQRDRPEPLPGV
jgi:hypothetical protein